MVLILETLISYFRRIFQLLCRSLQQYSYNTSHQCSTQGKKGGSCHIRSGHFLFLILTDSTCDFWGMYWFFLICNKNFRHTKIHTNLWKSLEICKILYIALFMWSHTPNHVRGVSLIITRGATNKWGVLDSKPPPIGGAIDSTPPLMEGAIESTPPLIEGGS